MQIFSIIIAVISAIGFIIAGNIPASILFLFILIILSFLLGVEHGVNMEIITSNLIKN